MWPYSFVTREEFEKRKDFAGSTLCRLGCTTEPWPPQKMTMYGRGFQETWISERPLYHYGGKYILISEALFSKPFIVLELKRAIEWEEYPGTNVT